MKIAEFIKKCMLPLAMLTSASVYLIYHYLPGPVHHAGPVLSGIVGIMQPLLIFAMLFPLLITPCLCAWLVRYLMPGLLRRLLRHPDLPFYLWGVAPTLAIAVTTKSIVKSDM